MEEQYQYHSIEKAIEDLRAGKIILVTDDPDRENQDKQKKGKDNPAPSSEGKNKGREAREKSKWAQVNDLLKNSSIELASVNEWIAKKFGKPIKINDLTDEQFKSLITALKKQIEKEESDE